MAALGALVVIGSLGLARAGAGGERGPHGLYWTRGAARDVAATEFATFSAGCFWGVEQEFRKTPGVLATAVGFSGGHAPNPSYEEVCRGDTGHAESVRVEYDPRVVSYDALLDLFWNLHDPTQKNRQGPDVGDQYRSIVFYASPAQKAAALRSRDRLARSGELGSRPIVTEILPAQAFYPAEEYHQQYVEKGGAAACHLRRKRANP
jgi:peptide-methionine (S)-S-oxide reductase